MHVVQQISCSFFHNNATNVIANPFYIFLFLIYIFRYFWAWLFPEPIRIKRLSISCEVVESQSRVVERIENFNKNYIVEKPFEKPAKNASEVLNEMEDGDKCWWWWWLKDDKSELNIVGARHIFRKRKQYVYASFSAIGPELN